MALERNRAYETDDNGYILSGSGVWLSSGSGPPTHDALDGDRYFQSDGQPWRRLVGVWKKLSESGTVSGGVATLNGVAAPQLSSSQTSYKVLAKFIFRGTIDAGTPSSISILAFTSAASGDIRIFDSKNAQTIAEQSFTNSVQEIIDMGAISNLPSDEAVFEIQGKKSGGGSVSIAALQVGL